ncbi:MAG: 50S ribosomal protein L18 [Spirochaetaceae bacterium]|nr:50S ribosomal protein L18 [Spirochaetaceae bacterium]
MSGSRRASHGGALPKRRRWLRRKQSIRKRIRGTAERPRLTVYKSNCYTYAQAIDDRRGHTLVSASSRDAELRDAGSRVAGAGKLGLLVGERLRRHGVSEVVFDRNGYPYHGRVRSLAEGVREAGISL